MKVNISSKAFKAFFEIENVRLLLQLVPATFIIEILEDLICSTESEPDPLKFNTCTEIINSDLIVLEGVTEKVFNVGKKFIIKNIPNTKGFNYSDVNEKTKDNIFNLTRTLYERSKTTEIADDLKEDFYEGRPQTNSYVNIFFPLTRVRIFILLINDLV